MTDVQILRQVLPPYKLWQLREVAKYWIKETEAGRHRYGRIYDDLWPLNLAWVEAVRLPAAVDQVISKHVAPYFPNGFTLAHERILCTTYYPHFGRWHRDAPPFEDDVIAMLCLDGLDELQFSWMANGTEGTRQNPGHLNAANLHPGDLCLMPASMWHRGRCTTHRITWHVRMGPVGYTLPPSPRMVMPTMTVHRFLRRTVGTLSYYLLRLPEEHWLCERYKWISPRS